MGTLLHDSHEELKIWKVIMNGNGKSHGICDCYYFPPDI